MRQSIEKAGLFGGKIRFDGRFGRHPPTPIPASHHPEFRNPVTNYGPSERMQADAEPPQKPTLRKGPP
jgi:hypothetical protein